MEVKAQNKVDARDEHKIQKQNILIWCNTPVIHLLGPCAQSPGFSRQEHWSGLPFPSPMHESEK